QDLSVQQQEALVQFIADVADGKVGVRVKADSPWQKFKDFLKDLMAALGYDVRRVDLSKPDNVRAFAAQVAKALNKGIKIEGLQGQWQEVQVFAARLGITVKEAQRQYDAVVARYTNPDGSRKKGWMKAPDGSDTLLNERQWVQVRTDAFKNWFGDWEFDAKNASKVVSPNGEPQVVYHGAGMSGRVGNKFLRSRATSGPMAFFTNSADLASSY